MASSNAVPFIAARDFLLRHREDYATAYRDFRWPALDRFNWALDYFDVMARDNAQPALWLVDDDIGETKLSFAALSERSNQIANALCGLGVRRGDRILVMLGNVVPLWECMLAAMKLGAVIVPATTLLNRNDLADRFARAMRDANAYLGKHEDEGVPLIGAFIGITEGEKVHHPDRPQYLVAAQIQPMIDVATTYKVIAHGFDAQELISPAALKPPR